MNNVLTHNWWLLALRGLLAIAFGLFAILLPGIALLALMLMFAAYLVVDGVFAIFSGVRALEHHERWGALVAEGLLDIAGAAVIVLWPGLTLLVLIYVAGFWAIFSGAALLAAAIRLRREHGEWSLVLAALLSLIWGALVVFWPIAGVIGLAWWIGVYALLFGGLMLVIAFRLRPR